MVRGHQCSVQQLAERAAASGDRVHGRYERGRNLGANHQPELLLPLQAEEHRGLQAGQRSVVVNGSMMVFIYKVNLLLKHTSSWTLPLVMSLQHRKKADLPTACNG